MNEDTDKSETKAVKLGKKLGHRKYPYPLIVVEFVKILNGMVGLFGTYASYVTNTASKPRPISNVAKTWSEAHEYCVPPHVNPMTANVLPIITMRLPLVVGEVREALINKVETTDNQSILATFSTNVPSGVRTRRKKTTRNKEIPEIGKLRSRGVAWSNSSNETTFPLKIAGQVKTHRRSISMTPSPRKHRPVM